MSQPRRVVVTGATGQQGGAVTRALLARDIPVRALVRSPDSPAAARLRRSGVELVVGRLEEPASLDRALTGAEALFAVTTPFEGIAAEAHKGIALIDAARRAGISHLVYTSACHADQSTGIPSFESKLRVEQHLRASGVPFTIVAPVYFMENLLTPFSLSRLREGQYVRWLPLERTLQQITVEDIGRFCAWVFEHREDFLGRRIDIAGDELDGPQAAALLSGAMGRGVEALALSLEGFPADGELGQNTLALLAWLANSGFHAEIPPLRRQYPEIGWRTFAQWVAARDWGEPPTRSAVMTERDRAKAPTTEEELRAVTLGAPTEINGQIQLAEYDPQWPVLFTTEAARLRAALGERALLIEHAGSTSVPGLVAKPIIDIIVAVADPSDEPTYVPALEAAGYRLRIREPDWEQHRLLRGTQPDVNLHVFPPGSREVARMLMMRDWLRTNDADRELYATTKRELASRHWKYVQQYADAKTTVLAEIMARAEAALG